MIPTGELRTAIRQVEAEINEAESDLAKVIGALASLPRAEKVRVSRVVEDAFARLRTAHTRLDDLERRLGEESPPEP